MTLPELAVLLITVVAASFGIWLGVGLAKRAGFVSVDQPLKRRVIVAFLMTGAIIVGLWIGGRGNLTDPGAVILGLMFWAVAMFMAFRRPKRG